MWELSLAEYEWMRDHLGRKWNQWSASLARSTSDGSADSSYYYCYYCYYYCYYSYSYPPTHRWSSVLGVLGILPFAFMMIPHPPVLNSTQIPHDPTSTQLRSQLRSHVSSYTAQIQLTQHQLCWEQIWCQLLDSICSQRYFDGCSSVVMIIRKTTIWSWFNCVLDHTQNARNEQSRQWLW